MMVQVMVIICVALAWYNFFLLAYTPKVFNNGHMYAAILWMFSALCWLLQCKLH